MRSGLGQKGGGLDAGQFASDFGVEVDELLAEVKRCLTVGLVGSADACIPVFGCFRAVRRTFID